MSSDKKRVSGRQFAVLLLAIAIIGAGALGYVATRPRSGSTTIDPNLPPETAQSFLYGLPDAPVQITEFADVECPLCSEWATITEPDVRARLVKAGLVAIRFYVWPLPMHKNTWAASNAAYCAKKQEKFWEMHDRLFTTEDLWNGQATAKPDRRMKGHARDIGLDEGKFGDCYDSRRHFPNIKASAVEAERRGLGGTPTFIIDNRAMEGRMSYDEIRKLVEDEIARKGRVDASVGKTPRQATARRGDSPGVRST